MSYAFDGANDRLTAQFADGPYGLPCTIACMFKVTAHPLANDCTLAFGSAGGTSINDSIYFRSGVTDNLWTARLQGNPGSDNAAFNLDVDNVWAPIVGVYTDTSIDIYIVDIANTSNEPHAVAVADTLQFVRIGENNANGEDFTGLIAEPAIWNKALDLSEIEDYLSHIAASGIAPANLIGYWPLNADGVFTNLGIDSGGTLSAGGNVIFDADHPSITTGGGAAAVLAAYYASLRNA